MRGVRHLSAVATLVLGALSGARADTYPVSTIHFREDAVTFASAPVVMPAAAVVFPSGPMMTETAATIEVTLPADVLFDADRSDIRGAAEQPLHELADLLRVKSHGRVMIQSYTDGPGNDAYSQMLSERRATAVKMWLATREGLTSTPFITAGFGPRNPVAPNRNLDGSDNPEGRELNRRVTFIIHK